MNYVVQEKLQETGIEKHIKFDNTQNQRSQVEDTFSEI